MKRFIAMLSMVSASAVMLQVGGCGGVLQYIGSYNPCLTIVACNPAAYEFARSGLEGFTFDPAIDPFCALPPFCGPDQDPIFGTVLGGG